MTHRRPNPVPLGAFELHAPIGEGGMGVVWSGVHVAYQLPVAVKIITAPAGRGQSQRSAFVREVQAHAGLSHPSIVTVYDMGEIGEETARAARGALAKGSPYFVMELATGGPMSQTERPTSFSELCVILLTLLDALAHAHARGVIHRDIKLSNILLTGDGDSSALKLTDFGIAFALEDLARGASWESKVTGTIVYMAPEQILGQWRDQGPWTDLYALGCLAWWLATGAPPFGRPPWDYADIAKRHLLEDLPPFRPTFPTPAGFTLWLDRLLAKIPLARYQRGAEAAGHLLDLLAEVPTLPLGTLDMRMSAHPSPHHSTPADITADAPTTSDAPTLTHLQQSARTKLPTYTLALPTTWRAEGGAPPRAEHHIQAGLGLFGLREIPFVGRGDDRDAIWDAFVEAAHSRRAQAIVVKGASGTGKSRLVEWMAHRTHEIGAAQVLRASHSPIAGPLDSVLQMVESTFRCVGLDRDEVYARLLRYLDSTFEDDGSFELDAASLTELLRPQDAEAPPSTVPPVRFTTVAERRATLIRVFERTCAVRPVVVWLDDIQWGGGSLELVKATLDRQATHPCALLFLITVREDRLPERPFETMLLDQLTARDDVHTITLAPLDAEAHLTFIRALLDLTPDLAASVVARTEGNPLFTVQLVRDWVQRRVLRPTDSGLQLALTSDTPALPRDIQELWNDRIDRVLTLCARPRVAHHALELAAALGQHVNLEEWGAAMKVMDLRAPSGLVDILAANGLVRRSPHGFTFIHAMLREALTHAAITTGRWTTLHRACATMLERHNHPSATERRALHLIEASEGDTALALLVEVVAAYVGASNAKAADRLLQRCHALIDALDLPPLDARRAELHALESRVALHRADPDRAMDFAERALAVAVPGAHTIYEAQACLTIGFVHARQRHWTEAERHFERAHALALKAEDAPTQAWALRRLAKLYLDRGEMDKARKLVDRTLDLYKRFPNGAGAVQGLLLLGKFLKRDHQLDKARRVLEQARVLAEHLGTRMLGGDAVNTIAEIDRLEGDLDAAEDGYRKVILLWRGHKDLTIVRHNLAMVTLERGDAASAATLVRALMDDYRRTNNLLDLAYGYALTMACHATLDQPIAFDQAKASTTSLIDQLSAIDADFAICAEIAGDALAHKHPSRAIAAYRLATKQWTAVKRLDRAQTTHDKIMRLEAQVAPS